MFMMSYTLEKYKETMKSVIPGLMSKIIYYTHKKEPQPIRVAISYVEKNFHKKFNLEDIADEVHFESCLFLKIF